MNRKTLAALLRNARHHRLFHLVRPRAGRPSAPPSSITFIPKGEQPDPQASIPELQLPLRVGIAFRARRALRRPAGAERERLLRKVKDAFASRPYIAAIEVIPTTYLRAAVASTTSSRRRGCSTWMW